jgi:hypothetical protein
LDRLLAKLSASDPNDPALGTYILTLTRDEIAALLITVQEGRIEALRPLLQVEATRHQAIQRALEAFRSGAVTTAVAQRYISELQISFWNYRSSPRAALQELLEAVITTLSSSPKQSTSLPLVLELLPTLSFVASTSSTANSDAASLSRDIVKQLLRLDWTAGMLPGLLEVLTEMPLEEEDSSALVQKVEALLGRGSGDSGADLHAAAAKGVLQLYEKHQHAAYLPLLRSLIHCAPAQQLSTLLCLLELSFLHNPPLCALLLRRLEDILPSTVEASTLLATDLCLLLCLSRVEQVRERGFSLAVTCLCRLYGYFECFTVASQIDFADVLADWREVRVCFASSPAKSSLFRALRCAARTMCSSSTSSWPRLMYVSLFSLSLSISLSSLVAHHCLTSSFSPSSSSRSHL